MSSFDPELEDLVRELNQAAPGAAVPAAGRAEPRRLRPLVGTSEQESPALDALLSAAVRRGASDLLLIDGSAPVFRRRGELERGDGLLRDDEIRAMLAPLLGAEQRRELDRDLTLDFGFVRPGIGRFRANLHFQRDTLGAAIRALPAEIPTLESLGLPPILERLTELRKGLILVTGAAGSGKTTTLAAMIGRINARRACHVIAVEDPIEYRHENRRAVVEQIEVGRDARGFASALRGVLRQSPDVILIGEMRDRETLAAAVTAAETGHLVLASLHTADAARAVGRVIDGFPADQQNQIRQQLALGLAAVVAQQLVPTRDGGRRPAVEILLVNSAVSNLIRRGEDHLLRSQLSLGRAEGMITMEESLAELARRGTIDEATALAHAQRSDDPRRYSSG